MSGGANAFPRTCSVLVIIALWSLISYQLAIAFTIVKADKIVHKPKRASYYARGLSQQPSPINVRGSSTEKGRTSDANQLEIAAGAGMLHQLIYELAVGYKHIPRVSLLTCHHGSPARRLEKQTWTSINIDTLTILRALFTGKDTGSYRGYKSDGGNITSSFSSSDRRRLEQQSPLRGVLIKVLRIDLLINSPVDRGTGGRSGANKKATDIPGLRTMEAFLQSEVLRQVVVLDLSCGFASRKVIEMASNKGLFNSSYHWLLIEDYTFNRQRDDNNDDADDDDDNVEPDGGVQNDFQMPFSATIVPVTSGGTSSMPGDKKINNIGGSGDYQDENTDNGSSVANDSNDNVGENNLLIEKFLEKINININTELILAKRINGDRDSKEDYYMLYDVWSPGIQYGSSLNITNIGKFTEGDGLQLGEWYRQTSTVLRRTDMKGSRIRCMIVVTNKNHTGSLEDYLTQQYDTHLDSMNRFNFALLSHVRDLFNFSLVMSRTASWGYLKNGKFDGMIGALVRRQADIGGSPIFFRIERAKVIDYTTRTWIARPCFMFRHPRSVQTNRIVFLQPFTNDVWVLAAICGGLSIVLLAALALVERYFSDDDSNNSSDLQVVVQARRIESAESAAIEGRGKNNQHQQRNISPTKDARKRGKKRQIGFDSAADSGGGDATTLSNERLNTKVTVCKRGQVPLDYVRGSGAGAAISNQNTIDCIDYRVGVTVPGNDVSPHHNDAGAGDFLIKKTLKKFSSLWRNHFSVRIDGIFCKDGADRVLESLLFYIGSICQQGLSFSTNLLSGRCIVITSLLFSFCINQFYSASIVGSLLMERPKTIRTLRDLVYSSLEIGIEDIIYNREYFLRTRDPDAIELYAKKVTTVPPYADEGFAQVLPPDKPSSPTNLTKEEAKKNYKAAIHSHETGAHAKTTEASNWYDPEYGVAKIKQGGFAFHIDVATAYKIISDTFTEKEICDLSEIQLFPPQKMVNIVQKGSPLRKVITYGLRRTMEAGLMDYQRKVWHSPKPRCVKQIHTDDLRVDMQTFTSAVFVLIFGFAASIAVLVLEMVHNNLWQYFAA